MLFRSENDYVEAVIALPNQLFYNTDIGIYIFVISKNKRSDRKGKVQLINAIDMYKPLRKSLGKKRREIDLESRKEIAKIYAEFKENEKCKIFPNEEFLYKEYVVYQPLQRTGRIDLESIEKLENSDLFSHNSNIFNQAEFGWSTTAASCSRTPRTRESWRASRSPRTGRSRAPSSCLSTSRRGRTGCGSGPWPARTCPPRRSARSTTPIRAPSSPSAPSPSSGAAIRLCFI